VILSEKPPGKAGQQKTLCGSRSTPFANEF
jgi:hypothetical protein